MRHTFKYYYYYSINKKQVFFIATLLNKLVFNFLFKKSLFYFLIQSLFNNLFFFHNFNKRNELFAYSDLKADYNQTLLDYEQDCNHSWLKQGY